MYEKRGITVKTVITIIIVVLTVGLFFATSMMTETTASCTDVREENGKTVVVSYLLNDEGKVQKDNKVEFVTGTDAGEFEKGTRFYAYHYGKIKEDKPVKTVHITIDKEGKLD